MSDLDDATLSPIPVHKNAWNQKDMLEGIVQRYVTIRSHTGGLWPTWEIESDQLEEKFDELNAYLEHLGWMARLRRGDTTLLTTLPLPHRQFPGSRIHVYMWTASIITLLLSAVRWMDSGRPTGGWFVESIYLDGLIGFVLPVLGTLLLASFVQTRISAAFGVRSGHILPIPDPSVLLWLFSGLSTSYFIWPFGIFFIPTLPRMDARPWPNRQSLAWTSVSVPVVMLVSGFVFWTLGLVFTTDPYTLSTEPFRANPPFLIELISTGFDFPYQTTLDWGHPFFFAASFLTLVGWLLMLPIPTFPGGRLLVARMGIEEARSSGTQILMFMLLITSAFFIFDAFNGFTIWIPVLSVVIPLLMFMGGDPRIPVLMDGDRPLSEDNHRRLGIVLFVAILFAIPAQFPVEQVERWDADATSSIVADEFAELSESWNASIMIELDNPSMQDRSYSVSGTILGTSLWNSNLSCEAQSCEGVLEPGESMSIEFRMVHQNTTHQPTFVAYQIDVAFDESDSIQEFGTIYPLLDASVASEWRYVRDNDMVLTCLDIFMEEGYTANLSLPDLDDEWLPFLWLDGQAGLTQSLSSLNSEICLNGVDQALPFGVQSMIEHVMIGNTSFMVGFDTTWPHIVSASEEGWLIDEHHPWGTPFDVGGTLYQENASSCTGNEFLSTPPRSNTTNWSWDLSIRPKQALPSVEAGERLYLKLPSDSYVHCNQQDIETTEFIVQRGPDLVLHQDNETIRLWDSPRTVNTSQLELALYNSNDVDVVLRHSTYGDVDWDLSAFPSQLSSGWNNITLDVPESMIKTYKITHQDGAILITFGAYLGAES